jgi:hypothetical protein
LTREFGLPPGFYILSAFTAVLFGLPAFFFLLGYDMIRWWSLFGVGMVIGALVSVMLRWPKDI